LKEIYGARLYLSHQLIARVGEENRLAALFTAGLTADTPFLIREIYSFKYSGGEVAKLIPFILFCFILFYLILLYFMLFYFFAYSRSVMIFSNLKAKRKKGKKKCVKKYCKINTIFKLFFYFLYFFYFGQK